MQEISSVDRHSHIPMYVQIASALKREILAKRYADDGRMDSHQELALRFGVSLITVRKAIQALAEEGVVSVKQGMGTYVRNAVLQDSEQFLVGVSNLLSSKNVSSEIEVRGMRFVNSAEYLHADTAAKIGETCLRVLRLHKVDDKVIAVANLYLPEKYGIELSMADLKHFTVYQLYQNKLGVPLGKGRQHISAQRAERWLADLLGVAEGWPVLQILRHAYSAQHELIEYMELYYDYRNYAFVVELDLNAE